MQLEELRGLGLIYLGTPYTKYPDGIEAAFIGAAKLSARLMARGLKVYSPIVYCHPIAIHGGIDPLNVDFWLKIDAPMMKICGALLIAKMESWEKSTGLRHEADEFKFQYKPVFYIDPVSLAVSP
jgi:hypothetical protein